MQAKHSSAGRLTLPVIVVAAVLAAVYAVVTVMSYPVAFGIWQFRLSEAMMLLIPLGVINLQSPLLADKEKLHIRPNNLGFAAAVGVTLGCFLANYFNPGNLGPVDYLGGTCATAVSAYITYKISGNNKALNSLPYRSHYPQTIVAATELLSFAVTFSRPERSNSRRLFTVFIYTGGRDGLKFNVDKYCRIFSL